MVNGCDEYLLLLFAQQPTLGFVPVDSDFSKINVYQGQVLGCPSFTSLNRGFVDLGMSHRVPGISRAHARYA